MKPPQGSGFVPTDGAVITMRMLRKRLFFILTLLAPVVPAIAASGSASEPQSEPTLWSLQSLADPKLPTVRAPHWVRNEVDRFVLARLEAAGLTPEADAGPRTMVRRAYFHLTGLPPASEVVEAFAADTAPDRFGRLVDRLLASPRFGERWGRHWLDLVRFAESSGREFNFTYPHAWPYRDYVIDSLNADKPYDRFLREQLAGDLIRAQSDGLSVAESDALSVATGFLAVGVKRHNAGKTTFRADIIDDQIDVTTRAILGMSVACARCHDHKFDPVPSRDYYALAGIFQSTELLYGTIKQTYSNHPTGLIPLGPGGRAMHEAADRHDAEVKKLSETVEAKKKVLEETKKANEADNQDAAGKRTEKETETETETEAGSVEIDRLSGELEELERELKRLEANRPPRPQYAFAARDAKKPVNAKVARRGNPGDLGDIVERGFLSCVTASEDCVPNETQSGRLELARWLTHTDNPLTARVMVNRVWHHLFGCGLVKTVDNFGSLGERPSHPELLDWLAVRFQRDGWSVKRLIRMLMMSRTYQLRSGADPVGGWTDGKVALTGAGSTEAATRARAVDPENRLLWRMTPRRLEAEAIRDSMLALAGMLDTSRPNGSTVTGLGDKLVRDIPLEKLQPPSRHRSVYLPVIRDYLPKFFEMFDFPSPNLVSGSRSATTVPLQDLFLQNDRRVSAFARGAAQCLLGEGIAGDESKVDAVFLRTFSRGPSRVERRSAIDYLNELRRTLAGTASGKGESTTREAADSEPAPAPVSDDVEVAAWAGLFQALFGSAEFRYLVDVD